MKSKVLTALALASFITLVGCETTGGRASEVEKRFYKECNPTPEQPPCGHY